MIKTITLKQVKKAQPRWFAPGNKALYDDVEYYVLYGKESNNPFLIRSTYAWTDMFGDKPRLHFRINPLNDMLHIEPLIDSEFADIDEVKKWLENN